MTAYEKIQGQIELLAQVAGRVSGDMKLIWLTHHNALIAKRNYMSIENAEANA